MATDLDDPSAANVTPHLRTPASDRRANRPFRQHLRPRQLFNDGTIPVAALPPAIDIENPPNIMLVAMGNINPVFNNPTDRRLCAQAEMILIEHFANRCMHPSMMKWRPWNPQNIPSVYNTFTRGLICYVCYCVGHGGWDQPIRSASQRCSDLTHYDDDALNRANLFGEYLCTQYPRLDGGNMWMDMMLAWNGGRRGLKHVNIRIWFDNEIARLRNGGIHSAAYISTEISSNRPLRSNMTEGILYQNVMVLHKITSRLDEYIERNQRWYITNLQRAKVENCTKLYNTD